MKNNQPTIEHRRLEAQRQGEENWQLWGPYLAERAWGTVREDYSADGKAWEHFTHDQSRSRAYRWNEDGLGGICDKEQRLCFSLALWNGCDPILKERLLALAVTKAIMVRMLKKPIFIWMPRPHTAICITVTSIPKVHFPTINWCKKTADVAGKSHPFN